jgi:hypothetical protein
LKVWRSNPAIGVSVRLTPTRRISAPHATHRIARSPTCRVDRSAWTARAVKRTCGFSKTGRALAEVVGSVRLRALLSETQGALADSSHSQLRSRTTTAQTLTEILKPGGWPFASNSAVEKGPVRCTQLGAAGVHSVNPRSAGSEAEGIGPDGCLAGSARKLNSAEEHQWSDASPIGYRRLSLPAVST